MSEPHGSATDASVLPNASDRLPYPSAAGSQKPPTYIMPVTQHTMSTSTGTSRSHIEARALVGVSSSPRLPSRPSR